MTTARYDGQTEWYEAHTSADVFANDADPPIFLALKAAKTPTAWA